MSVKIDDKDITDVKIGDKQISSIYAGTNLIWSASQFTIYTTTNAPLIYRLENIQYSINSDKFIQLEDGNYKATINTKDVKNLANFLYNRGNVYKVEVSKLNLKNCVSLDQAFRSAGLTDKGDLEKLDLTNIRTCFALLSTNPNLTGSFDASKWNTSNVTSFGAVFEGTGFESIKCNWKFNTNLSWQGLFNTCSKLNVIDLTETDTSKVNNLSRTFASDGMLEDIKGVLDCSNVTTMDQAFDNCKKLPNINIINVSSKCTNMNRAFANCASLTSLDTSTWDTSNVTSFVTAFSNTKLSSITNIDLSSAKDIQYMFYISPSLTNIDTTKWKNAIITSAQCAFQNCTALPSVDLSGLTLNNCNCLNLFNGCTQLTSFGSLKGSISNANSMFHGCSNLTDIDLSNVDFSNCTNTNSMFRGCRALATITGLDSMKLPLVTDMSSMFNGCYVIVNLPNFEATKVKSLNYTFSGAQTESTQKLEIADFSQWGELTGLTSLDNTFVYCRALREVHFSGEIANITNLQATFVGCTNLEVVDGVENWNTEKCQNLTPFTSCKIKNLNISGWSTKSSWYNTSFLPSSLEILTIGKGLFDNNSSTLKYLEPLSKWTDVTTIGIMLNALINHPKTADEDWQYTQTVSLSEETWNTIQNNETLSALLDEASDAGWEINYV